MGRRLHGVTWCYYKGNSFKRQLHSYKLSEMGLFTQNNCLFQCSIGQLASKSRYLISGYHFSKINCIPHFIS